MARKLPVEEVAEDLGTEIPVSKRSNTGVLIGVVVVVLGIIAYFVSN